MVYNCIEFTAEGCATRSLGAICVPEGARVSGLVCLDRVECDGQIPVAVMVGGTGLLARLVARVKKQQGKCCVDLGRLAAGCDVSAASGCSDAYCVRVEDPERILADYVYYVSESRRG